MPRKLPLSLCGSKIATPRSTTGRRACGSAVFTIDAPWKKKMSKEPEAPKKKYLPISNALPLFPHLDERGGIQEEKPVTRKSRMMAEE
jgi:hypothetical protein